MKKIIQITLLVFCALQMQAQYHSLLWQITGQKISQPSYLFGTMHTADARVFDNANRALPHLLSAKAYAMELDPDKMLDMSLLEKVMMGKDYSLKKMLPAKEYAFLDSLVTKQVGLPMLMFDNVEPVFVMTVLESLEMGLTDSSVTDNQELMDLYFYNQAKKAKKKIIGIETVEEQLGALNAVSYQEQADMLKEEIQGLYSKNTEAQDVLRFYLQQELDSLATYGTDMPVKLYKAMVTDRNDRMAERIGVFITQQPTFIAIGALHLPGKEGVIEKLRQKGFVVEPVIK